MKWKEIISSVQLLSHVQLFATPWTAARQASLSITNSQSSPKLMSIESVMPSSHLILCRPFLLLPPIPPSIRVFSNESILRMRWSKYWSFSFSVIPSKEHPELISFRMGWLDLLAVQGTLKSSPTPQFKRIYKHMQTHTIKEHYCVNIKVSRKEGGGAVETSTLRRRRCPGSSWAWTEHVLWTECKEWELARWWRFFIHRLSGKETTCQYKGSIPDPGKSHMPWNN